MDHDSGVAEDVEVTIRCLDDPAVFVRLYDRFFPDEYGVGFSIEAQADGLRASVGPVEVWVWDDADLPGFLAGLAEDFRGWAGERTWQTNHLKVQAVFHSRGHVALTWTLRPWVSRGDSWQTTVTTWLEAGAQMSTLADDIREFLPDPRTRTTSTNP
jgi:hypothetical protein